MTGVQAIDNADDDIAAEIDFSRGQRVSASGPFGYPTPLRRQPLGGSMTQLCIELPDAVHSVLHCAPVDVDLELAIAGLPCQPN